MSSAERLTERLLVAVGSRRDCVCSIGSFARAEAIALESVFRSVETLEPDERGVFPLCHAISRPDVIFFHAPALHDRKRPWNALLSAVLLKRAFPKAKLVSVVHEFSEAPLHWKARQVLLARLSDGVIVNSDADRNGMSRWHHRILRTRLGPPLFYEELLLNAESRSTRLRSLIDASRAQAVTRYGLDPSTRWIVHPGLITPGKGVNSLDKLAAHVGENSRLVVMGGLGPKARDQVFARESLERLRNAFKGQLTVVESPSDEIFRQMLVAGDLVILPYDVGLSERRSSFLSAMCCGANVWTTVGDLTGPLALRETGTHSVTAAAWASAGESVFQSVRDALAEDADTVLRRRVMNLEWASRRDWSARARDVRGFIEMMR